VIGTIINGVCIVLGGLIGAFAAERVSEGVQNKIKLFLVLATVFVATQMIYEGLSGSIGHGLGQLGIAMLSMVVGNALGMLLRLQKGLNKLGQYAKEKMAKSDSSDNKFNEGLITCTILFCVGPMAILGAIDDGLHGNYKILAVKGIMDGTATIGFTAMFGWGAALAVVPVVAYQGTITICAGIIKPMLTEGMLESIQVTGGMLIFPVTLVVLGVGKVPLANYLPALIVAPLLTHWWM
tara:strand:+ start:1855 stop:2568 length:714 start_codon:yes stop_codon:yes gene_type:complete